MDLKDFFSAVRAIARGYRLAYEAATRKSGESAGARRHPLRHVSSSSARETQGINSSVLWVGLLVGYTVSGFSE